MTTIKNNISAIETRLQRAASDAGRTVSEILLLAVSKTRTSAQIDEAVAAGINSFGENYLQEAIEKISTFPKAKLDWHFIGPCNLTKLG